MKHLTQEFNDMDKIPMFEICLADYGTTGDDEYSLFNIYAGATTLNTIGHNGLISIKLDSDFSLDENLQALYDLCIEDIMNKERV